MLKHKQNVLALSIILHRLEYGMSERGDDDSCVDKQQKKMKYDIHTNISHSHVSSARLASVIGMYCT